MKTFFSSWTGARRPGWWFFLTFLVSSGTTLPAQNLLTNGSFELPAYAGDGDAYATNVGFTLPGWTFASKIFLEYGTPTTNAENSTLLTRYADGRQAVCLNGDGSPIVLSQAFSTTAGHNYVLSFAQSDEAVGGPSVSQLKVTLGGIASRVFSRTNDTGWVVKSWHFTANSSSGNVTFMDWTTNTANSRSPFLDAVSILPASVPAAGFTTGVPGGTGTFTNLPAGPGLSGSNLVFFAGGTNSQQGIYAQRAGVLARIADLNTPIPAGSGAFTGFSGSGGHPPDPCLSGDNVVFSGAGSSGQQGIYAALGSTLIKIADTATAIPNASGNFTTFSPGTGYPPTPILSDNGIAFYGAGSSVQGIYYATLDGTLARIADTTTLVPNNSPHVFTGFNGGAVYPPSPIISGDKIAFFAVGGTVRGVYLSTGGTLSRVADSTVAIPGGTGNFVNFVGSGTYPGGPAVSGNTVLFYGTDSASQQGLYASLDGSLAKVVDAATPIPAGSGNFTSFSAMSLSGDAVAFIGNGAGGQQGLYITWPPTPIRSWPPNPVKVLDLNDTLDGKTITALQLSRTGLDSANNLLAFGASFSDGTQGLYTLSVMTDLRITSVSKSGSDLRLSYTSQVGHNYAVQGAPDLVSGSWATLAGTTNPGNGTISQTVISNALSQPRQFYRIQQAQ